MAITRRKVEGGALILRSETRGWSATIVRTGNYWAMQIRDEGGHLRCSSGSHRTQKAAVAEALRWLDPMLVERSTSWMDR